MFQVDIQIKNDFFFFLSFFCNNSIDILPRKFRSIQRFTEINLARDIRYIKYTPPPLGIRNNNSTLYKSNGDIHEAESQRVEI